MVIVWHNFQVGHYQGFHLKAIVVIPRCGEAKTDLISSYKSVNVYVTFVCKWECVLCVAEV